MVKLVMQPSLFLLDNLLDNPYICNGLEMCIMPIDDVWLVDYAISDKLHHDMLPFVFLLDIVMNWFLVVQWLVLKQRKIHGCCVSWVFQWTVSMKCLDTQNVFTPLSWTQNNSLMAFERWLSIPMTYYKGMKFNHPPNRKLGFTH